MTKEMFGQVDSWNEKVDDFLKRQEEQNNDPKLLDALVNTPMLDIPLAQLSKARDLTIKAEDEELKKELNKIAKDPVAYVEDKISLYDSESNDNNYSPWTKKTVENFDKVKKNTNVARAIGTVASDDKKKTNKTTWQIMLEGASPEEKPAYRKILNREYYKRGSKNLSEQELRFIGKHPDQLKQTPVDHTKDTVNFFKNINEIRQLHKESKATEEAFNKLIKQDEDRKQSLNGGLAYLMGETKK